MAHKPYFVKDRPIEPVEGLGWGVFKRNIQRGEESWLDVSKRVALGNTSLHPERAKDYDNMQRLIAKGAMLLSGRHLQHGDKTQAQQNGEKFTNCSTACTTSLLFLLLLNGSGVGRCYDDDMMEVDWAQMPELILHLDRNHPDYESLPEFHRSNLRDSELAQHEVYMVGDSREGWAKAIELLEERAWVKNRKTIVLDFSAVRPEGAPIKGMQDRPASGPAPLMKSIWLMAHYAKKAREENWMPWKTTLVIDHLLAECVVFGGARRSARIAVKFWKDAQINEFVDIKEDLLVLNGLSRKFWMQGKEDTAEMCNLWSANNSVAVDQEFEDNKLDRASTAGILAKRITFAQLNHMSGEPGFLNVHKLSNQRDIRKYNYDKLPYIGAKHYRPSPMNRKLLNRLAFIVGNKSYQYIVNPCAEIALNILCGFCVVVDGAPYFCDTLDEVRELYRQLTRTAITTNLMPSIYSAEVKNTNRIGVGITGIFSFAWKFFGITFDNMIHGRGLAEVEAFWDFVYELNQIVNREAVEFSAKVGLPPPLTTMTIKPSGSVSKLFALEEGAHELAEAFLIRWVQYKSDDSKFLEFKERGYPTKMLQRQANCGIVGFPTTYNLTKIMPPEFLTTARDHTPEEHFEYLRTLEYNYIDGRQDPKDSKGNQISYTLKFDAMKLNHKEYHAMMMDHAQSVKVVSVLPYIAGDSSAYEYLPEQTVTREEYDAVVAGIKGFGAKDEDIDEEHLKCASGACPI